MFGCVLMVSSMTGFGRGKSQSDTHAVTVEIKTVNHRFLECQVRMPRQLLRMEDKIRKLIAGQLSRGRVEVYVTISGQEIFSPKIYVNWNLLDEYVQAVRQIREKYELHSELSISDLLRLDDVFSVEEEDNGIAELEKLVLEAVNKALTVVREARLAEGAALAKDVLGHLEKFKCRLEKVKEYVPAVVEQYTERLKKRMTEFANGELDEGRLLNEVAVFADRADISEELARLASHIVQFENSMKLDEPIGRKLDFFLQEMNREVNTIGAKANDAGIALEVVEMKSLLEKMKEQVQNIE